jgi:FAD dependent oxidoreductase TIGR03364
VAEVRPVLSEALAVLREYAAGDMGAGCELWSAATTRERVPRVSAGVMGALSSPHELRVEARDALPRIAAWLERRHGVVFSWETIALGVEGTTVRHVHGALEADAIVLAPGTAVATFAPQLARRVGLRHCKLQMLRLAAPGLRLPGVVMGDLSLARYEGFAAQPAARRLQEVLARECAPALAHGVHLIVAQSADGSLVVGDSHHYAAVQDPFAAEEVEGLILDELHALFELPRLGVLERWLGYYPVAEVRPVLSEALAPRVRLVSVTSGTGMSTAFAIGEETVAALFG